MGERGFQRGSGAGVGELKEVQRPDMRHWDISKFWALILSLTRLQIRYRRGFFFAGPHGEIKYFG